jgi:hypothetical protein
MNATLELSNSLESLFRQTPKGVVGLVDGLLKLCPPHGLQLDWQAGRCRIRSVDIGSEELLLSPMRKSMFRAILARVAALCNERRANTVSPYGGEGELFVDADPPAILSVIMTNSSNEQKLELMPVPADTREFQTAGEKERSDP